MNQRPRFVDHIDLAALRTAVNCSRLFTKYLLNRWGAPSLIDDATLIVSELVTNAVKATGNMDEHPKWSELHDLKLIKVRLVGLEASVVFEVWDTSEDEPVLTEAGDDDEGGRGLFLVEELASRWGSYAQPRGKVVWAELPVYARTPGGLPIRQRKAPADPSVQPTQHDLGLLRRVRDGLQDL
ncbi:ATP-binding protein [Streptomyces sp. BBFR109]|uniref:ATP-binding protein n=1 Tax=Streptomyces sp. BBFR109 TaxID=3448172 RepID=UPI003F7588A9